MNRSKTAVAAAAAVLAAALVGGRPVLVDMLLSDYGVR